MDPIILGITSLRLYGSMKRQAALDAPSIHKNILIVDIKGRLDMSDLKKKRYNVFPYFCNFVSLVWNIISYLKCRIDRNV